MNFEGDLSKDNRNDRVCRNMDEYNNRAQLDGPLVEYGPSGFTCLKDFPFLFNLVIAIRDLPQMMHLMMKDQKLKKL
jgi:hypothetical protein